MGLVVRNRVKAGWLGGDWLAVIEEHEGYQFGDNNPWPRLTLLDFDDPLAQRLCWKVDDIVDGKELDITEGALWYAATPSPRFVEMICAHPDEHPLVARVGKTKFYK